MKLIVTYTEGDGCTYSCEVVKCVEYESAEKLYCDLEAAADLYAKTRWPENIDTDEFRSINLPHLIEKGKVYMPEISTLEEWWEDNCV